MYNLYHILSLLIKNISSSISHQLHFRHEFFEGYHYEDAIFLLSNVWGHWRLHKVNFMFRFSSSFIIFQMNFALKDYWRSHKVTIMFEYLFFLKKNMFYFKSNYSLKLWIAFLWPTFAIFLLFVYITLFVSITLYSSKQ